MKSEMKYRLAEKFYKKGGIIILWIPILLVPLAYFCVSFFVGNGDGTTASRLKDFLGFIWPFVAIFAIHDLLLVRHLYMKGRVRAYVAALVVLLAVYSLGAYLRLGDEQPPRKPQPQLGMDGVPNPPFVNGELPHASNPPSFLEKETIRSEHKPTFGEDGGKMPGRKGSGSPNPMAVDIIIALLLIGSDLSACIFLKYAHERERNEQLEKRRLQNELQYLKAQLDPHFFMNTLNNIHAMIELDPTKAQGMVMELSGLMRYVLYEGSRQYTSLGTEINFIVNYVELMRKRYSSKKVGIKLDLPSDDVSGIRLPPLLFIVVIENAFKHGISYRGQSDLVIGIDVLDDHRLRFVCSNPVWPKANGIADMYGGIGLENLRKRLALLYGTNYVLDISETEKTYTVKMIIPFEDDGYNKVHSNR